jgi:hypothetical protein
MVDWLIIGGGIHGTYLSNLLTGKIGVKPDDLRVLDPQNEPLARWHAFTRNCGMHYLRSPAAHNLDLNILSVYRFAKSGSGKKYADFIDPYFRPSRQLFEAHCRRVVRRRGLDRLRIQGRAVALHAARSTIETELEDGDRIAARHVLLALGLSEQPQWPQWAVELRRQGANVSHLLDPAYEGVGTQNRIAVIGGGSSGAQVALALSGTHAGRVTLLSRHPLRVSRYDFDPCWIGPKCMRSFARLDWGRRRQVVDRNRFPGTIPEDVARPLDSALTAGRLDMQVDRIRRAAFRAGGIELTLAAGTVRRFDAVVLATGFEGKRPGGGFVDRAIEALDLKCAPCGYPVLDEHLRWHERLFVTGPLAELQIGPCARNIIGARNAGRRLEAFCSGSVH